MGVEADRVMSIDDCVARAARRAIDAISDPAMGPINRCGHCTVCVTAPSPLPPVPVRKARSWWPYAAAAAVVGFAAVWRWQR